MKEYSKWSDDEVKELFSLVENYKKRSKIYSELSALNNQEVNRLVGELEKIDTE